MQKLLTALFILSFVICPFFILKAEARGGYGGERGGESVEGPRGGEMEEGAFGGVAAEGPNGGEAVRGPEGAGAAVGPDGAEAARGPYGDAVAVGPNGGEAVRGPYGAAVEGPGGDVLVASRPAGAVAVGTRVAALPETAAMVSVGEGVYYLDGTTYYQMCDGGYCVVADPNAQSDNNDSE